MPISQLSCYFVRWPWTKAPLLDRYYPAWTLLRAFPPPRTTEPAPHGVLVVVHVHTAEASRFAHRFLFHACHRHYPGGIRGPTSLGYSTDGGLPRYSGGSASTLPVSRPARRSLALRPAWSL